MAQKYGMWGNGTFTNNTSWNALLPHIQGFNFRFSWSNIEPTAGNFDWTYFDGQLQHAFDAGIWVGFMIFAGPAAPIVAPADWLHQAPFNVPRFTNERDTYPDYMATNYKPRWYNMLSAVCDHISNTYTTDQKNAILFWMSAEGSTGDEGPFHGTVLPPYQYYEDPLSDEWETFKRDSWTFQYDNITNSSFSNTRLLINQGNFGDNYQWALDNTPTAWMKAGNFTHSYSDYADLSYGDRLIACRNSPSTDNRWRGEFEDIPDWWDDSPTQNLFAMLCNCLHVGLDIFNISYATASSYGYLSNLWAFEFFTRHAGVRQASETNKGFCAFRDVLDINDTDRFPETAPYGPVVDKNTGSYNSQLSAIISGSDPETMKAYRITYLTIRNEPPPAVSTYRFLSTNRIDAIHNDYPYALYKFLTTVGLNDQKYLQDFSFDTIRGNWFRFVEEIDQYDNSKPAWRIGPTTDYFGRYARRTAVAQGKTTRYFVCDPDLDSNGAGGNNVTISVTYFDSGTALWGVKAYTLKGPEEIMQMQNRGTGQWITKEITFDGFVFGGNMTNGSDIIFTNFSSTQDVTTALLEFTNNSKVIPVS